MHGVELGKVLNYAQVTAGLRELNTGMHFDLASAIGQTHPRQAEFAGVFYMGRHICSMDRDMIPEFKIWSVTEGVVEIPAEVAAKEELAWVHWNEVAEDSADYWIGSAKADTFDDGYSWQMSRDGTRKILVKNRGYRMGKTRGPIIKLGWRHTFERILLWNIPGIDRRTLAEKFSVDLLKFPVGSPEEVYDALIAE